MIEKIHSVVKSATAIAISALGLAIVLQVIFGHSVAFLGGNVIGTLISIVNQLGQAGLVGIVTTLILWKLLTKE